MKTYRLSFADSIKHQPVNADRTAQRSNNGMDFDVIYQVWSNRAAMARSIRMQERGEHHATHWRACVKLTDTEGY